MTENEAKSCIQGKLDCMNKCDVFDCKGTDECDNCKYCYAQGTFGEQKKALEIAIQALTEIQQYRAIGTVEEFEALKEKNNEHYSDTDELDGYGYTCTNKTCVERIRNKAIDEFYDEVLNFEDYIEPSGTSEFGSVLLYSGKDITNMICKIAEQMKVGGENK